MSTICARSRRSSGPAGTSIPPPWSKAEASWPRNAAELVPTNSRVADRLAITLNPDGKFSDDVRALQRGFNGADAKRPTG